ncbi:MAG: DNA gyrase inhibitor YacG [Devosia sp.]
MADNIVKLKPTRPCPICGKPSSQLFHPFCSARCADIDLNRWLSGAYVIPAKDEPEESEEDDVVIPGGAEDEDEF